MDKQALNNPKPMPEQIAYANVLFIGAWAGILIMIITYFIYISGLLPPHVGIELINENWDKGVDEFLKITNSPHGWAWIRLINEGDYLNFIGIVLLAVLTIICYLFLILGYKNRKDWNYLLISVLQVLVLTIAASGILGTGGH